MGLRLLTTTESKPSFTPVRSPLLQRKCACGNSAGLTGECSQCQKKKLTLQRWVTDSEERTEVPAIVHEVLRSPGQPLDSKTRSFMESRFGHDFSQVRVHINRQAAESAQSVDASAYTVRQQIVFDTNQYQPYSPAGQSLLAHELTHTIQQQQTGSPHIVADQTVLEQQADQTAEQVLKGNSSATISEQSTLPLVQRQRRRRGSASTSSTTPRVGTRFTHSAGSRSSYTHLTAEFDGREFVLRDGSTELMRVAAASGRPVSVRPADARACGGSTSDSYLNNPLYVGISDYGPIPEREFRFAATEFATFTALEQAQFTAGGHFTDPFGAAMHGGDWGAGRAPLHATRVLRSPHCGNTRRRSGFYIHGGSLSGSSGCIDIGNAGIAALLTHLAGYRRSVTVTVRYRHPAPSVGRIERAIGGAVYPGQQEPNLSDRLRGAWRELTGGSEE